MSGPRGGGGRMVRRVVARFREKGATAPERAMTAQELGLPPRFEEAMKGRLGSTGVFVELGGRYYLDEEKLRQVQEARGAERGWGPGGRMLTLRMARAVVGLAVIALILGELLVARSLYVSFAVLALLVLYVALTALQIHYLSKARSRWGAAGAGGGAP